MPVTATLSREFYEKFGDTVVIELINLLNTVDADSKATLRELNEANFARFDASMKQQFAEFNARVEQRFADANSRAEQRFADANARMEQRLGELQARVEQRLVQQDERVDRRFREQDTKFERRFAEIDVRLVGLEGKIEALKPELIKWMFLFFTGSALANLLRH